MENCLRKVYCQLQSPGALHADTAVLNLLTGFAGFFITPADGLSFNCCLNDPSRDQKHDFLAICMYDVLILFMYNSFV
jgi:hypothetical protein